MNDVGDARDFPRRVPERRIRFALAGMCVLLLIGGSLMGLAMIASGQTFSDLVSENAVNWKVKDVSTHTNTGAVQIWDYWFPGMVDGALEVPFYDATDGWFTVYVNNVWEGDLTGMKITAAFEIRQESDEVPIFVARRADTQVQLRLQFQTTGGAYEPSDLWWSAEDYIVLTSYELQGPVTDPDILNTLLVLEVELTPELWLNHDGQLGSTVLSEFEAAIADIHEIGFSFGRTCSLASGVALTQGDATFVLKSFELQAA
ncbi:MAG: hypothetical protein MUC90_01130 [Thermoplasmata archaeon]|jgi:hypothetical protein|nr:hypothetical protein [Thermoplasmata archaeon]